LPEGGDRRGEGFELDARGGLDREDGLRTMIAKDSEDSEWPNGVIRGRLTGRRSRGRCFALNRVEKATDVVPAGGEVPSTNVRSLLVLHCDRPCFAIRPDE
jgi:hypothetical protein